MSLPSRLTTSPDPRPGSLSASEFPAGDGYDDASLPPSRTALVHDWLPVYAGAERVLEQMITSLPASDLFSLIDFIPTEQRDFLQGKSVETSFIQRLPFARSKYRYYLPLAPLAIEQFDLGDYDVIVSSSYAVAKGVLTRSDQLHISYVHSPIRYAWDLHHEYLEQGGLRRGTRGILARMILHYMRLYYATSANRVDVFVANSHNVARRIQKTYRRPAHVIYPPVDVERFRLQPTKENFYLTMSRLVPYKRIDLIVEAFSEMPDKELIVIVDGPEHEKIRRLAGPNVTMLGFQPNEAVEYYMENARAFVFAAEEDFGIVPVEAQACGTPVIAYGRGGAQETVVPGKTGLFFPEQTADHLRTAVEQFESIRESLDPSVIRANAERFAPEVFRDAFTRMVNTEYANFIDENFVPNRGGLRSLS